jgi:NitT/TauT family transport system permease protein
MIGKPISKQTSLLCAALCVAVLVAAYSALATSQHRKNPDDRTIPTWRQLWSGLVFLCEQPTQQADDDAGDLLAAALQGAGINESPERRQKGWLEGRILWEASKASLGRLCGGLSLGLAGGIVMGILMGCFHKVDAALSPVLYFASRIIATAAMPIFFKLAGIELQMYIAMIAFGSMPIVTLTVSQYVREFPEELRFKAYTLGASHSEVITTAIFPCVLPRILDLAILTIGPALVYLIAAEQIVAGEGFGYRIRVLTKATRFEVVYPLIIILTVYAGMMTWGLRKLRRKLCPWYEAMKR